MADDRAIRIPVDIDDKAAQKELQALTRQITSMEGKINQKTAKRNAIAEQLQTARQEAVQAYTEVERLQKALDASRAKTSGRDATGNPTQFVQELERQKQITAELSTQEKILSQKEAAAMRLEQQDARLVAEIDAQNGALQNTEQQAAAVNSQLQQQATKHWPQIRDRAREALQGANSNFNRSLKSLLRYGFGIRSVYMLFRRLRTATIEGVKAFAAYDSETQTSINNLKTALGQLKGAWAAAVAPIFNAVAPAIQWFIDLITAAANAVATFFAVVQGKSSYKKAVYNLDAVGEAASGAASDVEELKNQFSGLDEINTWNADNGGGGGGGGGSGGSGSGLSYVDQAIDMNSRAARLGDFVRENLESVELLVDIFGFAIGVILLCSGNILLGLGFMLYFGYKGIKNATANWDAISEQLNGALGKVVGIVSAALLGIGAILAFSGANIPLGLGLMAAGAASLATVVVANWGTITQSLEGTLGDVLTVVGKGTVAIGALLALSGVNIPLGLALIAAGIATTFAVKQAQTSAKGFLSSTIADLADVVKDAALIAGLIAMVTGNVPLGVALLAMAGISAAISGANKGETLNGTPVASWIEQKLKEAAAAEDLNAWLKDNPEVADYMDSNPNAWLRLQELRDAGLEEAGSGGTTDANVSVGLEKNTTKWNKDADTVIKAVSAGSQLGAARAASTIKSNVLISALKGQNWSEDAAELATTMKEKYVTARVGLTKDNWSTLQAYVEGSTGGKVAKGVGLSKEGWATVQAYVNGSTGGAVAKAVGLSKTGWTTLQNYVNASPGGAVSKGVSLYRDGWSTVSGWVNNYLGSGLRVGVTLAAGAARYAASGGYITNGELKSWGVPQYAGGTTRAHGTMFVAGEAGAEIVGNINGRTEILNRSQLASVMYAAVVSGMARVLAPAVTVLDRIADLLAGPQLAAAGSAVAAGVVVPPQFTRGGSDRLGQIADMLDRLESRLGGGAGGGSYQFTAQLNRRTIFDEIIAEAQLRQAQTGRNPFNF